MEVCLWASSSVCLAIYCTPALLLRPTTDLSSLTASLHCLAACAMALLAAGTLVPQRVDLLVSCSQSPDVNRGLMVYFLLHSLAPCASALLAVCRACDRDCVLRLSQIVVLGLVASVASTRHDALCHATRPILLVVYVWAAVAFALCHRIERALGLQDPKAFDDDVDDERSTSCLLDHRHGAPSKSVIKTV